MASMVCELNKNIEHLSNDNDMGKIEVFKEKPVHIAYFFTKNPTQIQIYVIL